MRTTNLLNADVSTAISHMGHTDQITIADCGLPIKGSAQRIDLALYRGVPGFLQTLDAVLSELCVERAILADEIRTVSPDMCDAVLAKFGERVHVEFVPHEELKRMSQSSVAVVRTGECTSYANVILQSGVSF